MTEFTRDNTTAYKYSAWSAVLLLLYSLATILIVVFIGGPPETVQECFDMLAKNRFHGILRLDVLTIFIIPFYYLLFYGIYLALKDQNRFLAKVSFIFICAGVTLFLSAPSVFSFVQLQEAYARAGTELEKESIWSAAQALLITDIWHGTGPRLGGILVQSAATTLSILMVRSSHFNKTTAYTGIFTHGLDFIHALLVFSLPSAANAIMAVSGALYLLWFPLIIFSFFKLAAKSHK